MTTETNSVLDSVKDAFAPVTDAFKNLEVPEAAREFVKKSVNTAKDRAADLHANSEKVTDAIETAVAGSVSEAAKISRNIQQALYQDAEAFFAGIDRLASAKSLNEAFQIQSDMVRARGEVLVSRAKSTTEYLGKL
ncbi:MAG: phasin family protein, partial [Bradyrhizobium sp.]